jgi:glycosyltransferase involved in cell wall biosynthesis
VGFLGRFDERKGLLDLARAWPAIAAAVPRVHLVLGGKGPLEDETRAVLADAPRVIWAGFRSDVAAFLGALDLLVVPSHWEGFGLVAAEALAAGLPVVAAAASSLPEIVRHGREGVLVPPHDPVALASAVIGLLRDPEGRKRMAAAGLARVREEFTVDRMVDRYESLLTDVVARRGR